jgi:hypothetical protein
LPLEFAAAGARDLPLELAAAGARDLASIADRDAKEARPKPDEHCADGSAARPAPPAMKQQQFPIPTKPNDAVFLMATQFSVYGDSESFLSVIHSLGHCDMQPTDLPDTVIFEFDEDREQDMLEHWSTMIRHLDLEWLAGYNSMYARPGPFDPSHVSCAQFLRPSVHMGTSEAFWVDAVHSESVAIPGVAV